MKLLPFVLPSVHEAASMRSRGVPDFDEVLAVFSRRSCIQSAIYLSIRRLLRATRVLDVIGCSSTV